MNELFINKKVWKEFNEEELQDYINKVYNHYRKSGFPYFELTESKILQIFEKMKLLDTSTLELEDNCIKQIMIGLNVVNYYMPHIFETRSGKFKTPLECFTDDEMLLKAIRKRIQMGDNMSDAGMRKALSWTHGTHRVSNFRPSVAKFIYDKYAGEGTILDFSSGFGGRLFGALSSNVVKKYIGTDPNTKTYNRLLKMEKDLSLYHDKYVKIHNKPIEDLNFGMEFDLSFSSPPYFDTEQYSHEDTQSFIRYKTKEEWRDGFLRKLIENNYDWVKKGGYFIINIANVKSYKDLEDDTLKIAKAVGFKLQTTHKMLLSSLMSGGYKFEPIFVFKK